MKSNDAADPEGYVEVRPYSADSAAAEERRQATSSRSRIFRPTLPTDRRAVEQSSFSSVSADSKGTSAEAMLNAAYRRQELQGGGSMPNQQKRVDDRFTGKKLSHWNVGGIDNSKSEAASLASKVGGLNAPRKAKERREGRSTDLMDLAFNCKPKFVNGEWKSNYTPISLPYYDVGKHEPEVEKDDGTKATRPKMAVVDEAAANAANIFLTDRGDLKEDKLFLMQLPSILPELLDPLEEVHRENEDAATAGSGASITRFPDGKLGKLKIYKSGKVRMVIGGLEFCLDQGCETFFRQDLACVCPLANEIISLGQIEKRVVLTPDLDSMLTGDSKEPSSSASAAAQAAMPPPAKPS